MADARHCGSCGARVCEHWVHDFLQRVDPVVMLNQIKLWGDAKDRKEDARLAMRVINEALNWATNKKE